MKPAAIFAVVALVVGVVAVGIVVQRSGGSGADHDAVQGDADCSRTVDAVDALADLRYVAGVQPFAECVQTAGDADCDGAIESTDALRILRYIAGLPALAAPGGCPPVGEPLAGSPSPPAASRTPTAAPSPARSQTPMPTSSPAATATPSPSGYRLVQDVPEADFGDMLDFVMVPGSDNQALVVRQSGVIMRVSLDGSTPATTYGDISDRLRFSGEEGLLSLAFSPQFATDHRVYVYYTQGAPEPSVLSRFQVVNGVMDTTSETRILEVPQPYANHNGGRIVFGPDGMLYLSLGDGGSEGDPDNNGQNTATLLGKLLRLDVTGEATYVSPPDNPFAGGGGRPEIWAYGLRNPWRYSFDRTTGDLWLADVGQDKWEEVDRIIKGGNYGWRCYEGVVPYNTDGCPSGGFQPPRAVYDHSGGNQSVTGGYVYRGAAMPELYGWYVYADAYSGRVWAVDATPGATSAPVLLLKSDRFITSFAERPDGELLLITFNNAVYRLERVL